MSLTRLLGGLCVTAVAIIHCNAYVPRPTTPSVCPRFAIPSRPAPLSAATKERLKATISALKKTWVPVPIYGKKPDYNFTPHPCRGKYCRVGKRDLSNIDVQIKERQKRAVQPFRKDYRQLTKKEMKKYHKALKKLKKSSEYDTLVTFHRQNLSPGAHFGMAFLPWHREYLFQLESALKALGNKFRGVTIPFWDSCMDESLPDPRDCVVWWTKNFWGPGMGRVDNGKVAKNWNVTPDCTSIDNKLRRAYSGSKAFLLTRTKINSHIMPSADFFGLACLSPLEGYHGDNHVYVGGHVGSLLCSPNDPVFFFIHSMYDCLWYEWADQPKPNTYPHPYLCPAGGPEHWRDAPMLPFPGLINNDGFWDGYTGCHERPSKIQCSNDTDCLSPQGLLFCHGCQCHCKIREGGDCTGFNDNACYCESGNPECDGGTCVCN